MTTNIFMEKNKRNIMISVLLFTCWRRLTSLGGGGGGEQIAKYVAVRFFHTDIYRYIH